MAGERAHPDFLGFAGSLARFRAAIILQFVTNARLLSLCSFLELTGQPLSPCLPPMPFCYPYAF
jgi:hypothetical protein